MIEKILIKDEGERFYRFANADGKVWMMPARHLRTAMELYQPSGRNGILLKRWFPLLHRMAMVRRIIHAGTFRCRLNDELRLVLENAFHTHGLEFSLFCGTPCVHQKITMQISQGQRILGYCKIADMHEIASLFDKEAALLNELHERGVKNIPTGLYCGCLGDGTRLFVQSTSKTRSSTVVHEWKYLHDRFLARLKEVTRQRLKFEDSDYFKTLKDFERHYDWLPAEVDKHLLKKAIEETCSRWRGKEVVFSAYHADFTPWNMFVEKGELFVFDWEYARMTYPPMLDKYHFFTQTAIFERHWEATDIIRYIDSKEGRWIVADDYKAYLIDMIARFTLREQGQVNSNITLSMKLWNVLLMFLTIRKQ
ncbi:MAG: phosphotransferase [Muribaculaceae bacterium]